MTLRLPEEHPQTILSLSATPELKPQTDRSSDDFERRFWDRVDQADGCWPWTAGKFPNGYGAVWFEGKAHKAHRIAWRLTNGPLGPRENVLHRCDNPPCCNPDHLFVGSHADNTADMIRKGRHGRDGKRHLRPDQVLAIRERYAAGGVTLKQLGEEYNVSFVAIHLAVARKTWRDLP